MAGGTGARATPRGGDDVADHGLALHRILSLLATLSLFGVAFASEGLAVQAPATGVVVASVFGAGLVLAASILLARTESALGRLDVCVLLLALLALAAWATVALYKNPAYGTDEAAYVQASAEMLLHGHDPYGANLLPALSQFRVPINFATYTLNGGIASTLAYPALPVLVLALFVKSVGSTQAAPIADIAILMVTAVVMFRLLPARSRALASLVPIGLPILPQGAISGLTSIMCVALLVPVAYRWTDVGTGGRLTRRHCWQAVALGLALSTQQLAWFVAPFLLLGIYLVRRPALGPARAARTGAAYGSVAAATFLVVNAPFMVWGFGAWFSGVASPLTQHAIPLGEGLVFLTLFLHIGGGSLARLNDAAAALYAGLLIIYGVRFRTLGRGCFVLAIIPFFISSRSLAEYFMMMVAVIVVSIATVDADRIATAHEIGLSWRPARRWLAVTASVLPAGGFLLGALTAQQPLTLNIVELLTNGQLQSVWRIRVVVHNRSGSTLSPHFSTNSLGYASAFWNAIKGPARLAPGATATYTLASPNLGSMSGLNSPFVLAAVTGSPQTVSDSSAYTPQHYSVSLTPNYVDRVLPSGATTTFTAELRSPLGTRVQKSGVTIALGQVIYGQENLIPAQARINGAQEGATPVFAKTGPRGAATFTVLDSAVQGQPIYLQAWIQPASGYPFGYSEIVSVLWR